MSKIETSYGRPKPRILLEHVSDDMRATQVCEVDAIFAVCYKGTPIQVRTQVNVEFNYPPPKYSKTSFPTAAHAFNLADKLNQRFNTTEFSVVIMQVGRTITEK